MTTTTTPNLSATFARELVSQLWDEVQPLLEAHWREIAKHKDIPLSPNRVAYGMMETAGILRCFTARLDGLLIGYAAYMVAPALHYSTSREARQDVLFLVPAFRRSRIGAQLITFADDELRRDGVQVVHQHVKVAHNFGPLLERLGYEHVEHIYSKRLDR